MIANDILRTNFLTMKIDDPLSKVVGKFISKQNTEIIVLNKKGQYAGMLWKRALLRTKIDSQHTKLRKFVVNPATLTPNISLEKVASMLHNADFHVLPVLGPGKKVIGIVGARDVLNALQDSLGKRKAKELITRKLITLKEKDPISKAVTLLHNKKIDRIPIIDDLGNMVGIVALLDMVRRYLMQSPYHERTGRSSKHGRTSRSGEDSGQKPKFSSLPVSNLVNRLVVTASPNSSAKEIVQLLRNKNISSVILVQKLKPVGIVTSKDLLYAISRPRRE